MSGRPFRFLQAGDLHLELTLHGLAEVPDHLKATLIDAPFLAAEQVFETAAAEHVDFVVLTGDVIHPEHAGPRAITFLLQQFDRLAERDIAVYWVGGRVDPPGRWPSVVPLPENVHVFPKSRAEQVTHHRDEEPLVTLIGKSWSGKDTIRTGDFEPDSDDIPAVAVAYGETDEESVARGRVDFWALGGEHAPSTPCKSPCTAHYSGTPQGRSPADPGPRGCTLVDVGADGEAKLRFVATDAVRWHTERIQLDARADKRELSRLLHEKMRSLVDGSPSRDLLVSWKAVTEGQLAVPLRRGGLADQIVADLRQEFGHGQTAAWTVALMAESPRKLPRHWYDEDTILGDFVRALRDHQSKRGKSFDLASLLPDRYRGGPMEDAVKWGDAADCEAVLQQAAQLGTDLLRGSDPLTETETLAAET